jgi:hypothetical protein
MMQGIRALLSIDRALDLQIPERNLGEKDDDDNDDDDWEEEDDDNDQVE